MPQSTASPAGPAQKVKARQRAEAMSGAAIVLVCLGIGVVSLLVFDDILIPRWSWALLLLVCISTAFFSNYLGPRLAGPVFLIAVLSSWGLLLTVQNQGFVEVILIVVAASGSFVIPLWGIVLVTVANCAVIALHLALQGADPGEMTIVASFYVFIHVAAVTSTYVMLQESRLRAELEERNVQLTAAAVMLEDSARNAERLRISRELHDLIGHQLTVLNLELEAARHRNENGDDTSAGTHINQAAAVAKELLGDVRSTVSAMRDSDAGDITEALERMASAVPSLVVHVRVDDDVRPDESQATVLIRAAQEIMTNTVKHTEAAELSIEISRTNGVLRLLGQNDGSITSSYTPGNGLRGLEERVALLGGTMTVVPRDGFRVEVELPEQPRPVTDDPVRVGTEVAGAGMTGTGMSGEGGRDDE